MKPLVIEIPVIVGSNGKWCANGYAETGKDGPDWGFMADSLDDDGKYPSVERRYVVRATVFVPDDTPEVIIGATTDADASATADSRSAASDGVNPNNPEGVNT